MPTTFHPFNLASYGYPDGDIARTTLAIGSRNSNGSLSALYSTRSEMISSHGSTAKIDRMCRSKFTTRIKLSDLRCFRNYWGRDRSSYTRLSEVGRKFDYRIPSGGHSRVSAFVQDSQLKGLSVKGPRVPSTSLGDSRSRGNEVRRKSESKSLSIWAVGYETERRIDYEQGSVSVSTKQCWPGGFFVHISSLRRTCAQQQLNCIHLYLAYCSPNLVLIGRMELNVPTASRTYSGALSSYFVV